MKKSYTFGRPSPTLAKKQNELLSSGFNLLLSVLKLETLAHIRISIYDAKDGVKMLNSMLLDFLSKKRLSLDTYMP